MCFHSGSIGGSQWIPEGLGCGIKDPLTRMNRTRLLVTTFNLKKRDPQTHGAASKFSFSTLNSNNKLNSLPG